MYRLSDTYTSNSSFEGPRFWKYELRYDIPVTFGFLVLGQTGLTRSSGSSGVRTILDL